MRPLSKSQLGHGARSASAIAVVLSCVFGIALLAQFRSDTRLVVLHASVTDHKGKLVTNLEQNAFKVFENGQPQEVKIFRREDVPVSLGIIIDDSGSMMTQAEPGGSGRARHGAKLESARRGLHRQFQR